MTRFGILIGKAIILRKQSWWLLRHQSRLLNWLRQRLQRRKLVHDRSNLPIRLVRSEVPLCPGQRFDMVRLGNPGVQVSIGKQKDLTDRSDAIGAFLKFHELIAPQ